MLHEKINSQFPQYSGGQLGGFWILRFLLFMKQKRKEVVR